MEIKIVNMCTDMGLRAGIAAARGVTVAPSPEELHHKLQMLVAQRKGQEFPPLPVKDGVRGLLKRGGFKPTGRNKPASEYLAQSAREDRFPFINNMVDVNNYLSLLTGLPISLLDLDSTGDRVELRRGMEGESFVFNASGQEIDVKGLVCICREKGCPLGNPVKDSMEAKLKDGTTSLLGVIYAPASLICDEELERHAQEFASMFRLYGGARDTEAFIV